MKFSRSKKIKFVTFHVPGTLKKKSGKDERSKNCAKKMPKIWTKSSPIRMTLSMFRIFIFETKGL